MCLTNEAYDMYDTLTEKVKSISNFFCVSPLINK